MAVEKKNSYKVALDCEIRGCLVAGKIHGGISNVGISYKVIYVLFYACISYAISYSRIRYAYISYSTVYPA